MREKIIIGNWKMNLNNEEALKFFAALTRGTQNPLPCEVVICPPATDLYVLDEAFRETPYRLGAQNMHWEDSGAFTGEISPLFLRELYVRYVILGHSERRQYFGETDAMIQKKVAAALRLGVTPVICIGETEAEYNAEKTFEKLESQIKKVLDGQVRSDLKKTIWAYEPIWAIGTGKTPTAKQAGEVAQSLRNFFSKTIDAAAAQQLRILYGGSVSEEKARDFLKEEHIDGLLVGGASLDPEKFSGIIQATVSLS